MQRDSHAPINVSTNLHEFKSTGYHTRISLRGRNPERAVSLKALRDVKKKRRRSISPVSRANCMGHRVVSPIPAVAQNASSLLYGLINAEDERNVALGCLK